MVRILSVVKLDFIRSCLISVVKNDNKLIDEKYHIYIKKKISDIPPPCTPKWANLGKGIALENQLSTIFFIFDFSNLDFENASFASKNWRIWGYYGCCL